MNNKNLNLTIKKESELASEWGLVNWVRFVIFFLFKLLFDWMKLTEEELNKLQKLACIRLNDEEKEKLWNQLESIIALLDELGKLDLSGDIDIDENDLNNLKTISGTRERENKDKLLQNIEHKLLNNSVVIKSVLSE